MILKILFFSKFTMQLKINVKYSRVRQSLTIRKDRQSIRKQFYVVISGVAMVSAPWGKKHSSTSPSTKTTEFEVKNRCKSYGKSKSKTSIYCSYFVPLCG